jgi:anti-sigma factor RsiW
MTEFRLDDERRPEGAPMSAPELTCREIADFLMAYDDGELSEEVRRAFDAHLAVCPDCVAYLASYRATVALGRRAFADLAAAAAEEVPEELIEAVLSASRRLKQKRGKRGRSLTS